MYKIYCRLIKFIEFFWLEDKLSSIGINRINSQFEFLLGNKNNVLNIQLFYYRNRFALRFVFFLKILAAHIYSILITGFLLNLMIFSFFHSSHPKVLFFFFLTIWLICDTHDFTFRLSLKMLSCKQRIKKLFYDQFLLKLPILINLSRNLFVKQKRINNATNSSRNTLLIHLSNSIIKNI